ncbi:hypothetical protein TSMEX_000268 [Taenia solium]|eukprot:TsM_000971200 transcript=TsM_000971200 gene=TsM_000971200
MAWRGVAWRVVVRQSFLAVTVITGAPAVAVAVGRAAAAAATNEVITWLPTPAGISINGHADSNTKRTRGCTRLYRAVFYEPAGTQCRSTYVSAPRPWGGSSGKTLCRRPRLSSSLIIIIMTGHLKLLHCVCVCGCGAWQSTTSVEAAVVWDLSLSLAVRLSLRIRRALGGSIIGVRVCIWASINFPAATTITTTANDIRFLPGALMIAMVEKAVAHFSSLATLHSLTLPFAVPPRPPLPFYTKKREKGSSFSSRALHPPFYAEADTHTHTGFIMLLQKEMQEEEEE